MVRRMVRAYGRAFEHAGDEAELGQLLEMPAIIDAAISEAIEKIRARGEDVNWAYVGRMAGITRQAARQRWDERARAVQDEGRRRRAEQLKKRKAAGLASVA